MGGLKPPQPLPLRGPCSRATNSDTKNAQGLGREKAVRACVLISLVLFYFHDASTIWQENVAQANFINLLKMAAKKSQIFEERVFKKK